LRISAISGLFGDRLHKLWIVREEWWGILDNGQALIINPFVLGRSLRRQKILRCESRGGILFSLRGRAIQSSHGQAQPEFEKPGTECQSKCNLERPCDECDLLVSCAHDSTLDRYYLAAIQASRSP
jgi:hypothetical protein